MSDQSTVNIYTLHMTNVDGGNLATVFPSKEAFFAWVAATAPTAKGVLRILDTITPDGFKDPADVKNKFAAKWLQHWDPQFSASKNQWRWEFGDDTILLVAHRLVADDLESATRSDEEVLLVEEEYGSFEVSRSVR